MPPRALASAPALGFRDLVGIKTILGLLESGVSLRRIRSSLERIRARIPEIERPAETLRVGLGGARRLLVRHAGALYEPNGQLVLDFGLCWDSPEGVASLAAARLERAADPDLAMAWFERGCQLDSDRATQNEAIEAYRRSLAADPSFADAYCNLGTIYYQRGQRPAARDCYERALRCHPAHVEANLNLAGLFEEEGREALALQRYKAALRADPLLAEAHLAMALLYERFEARRRARQHWRRYLQLAPRGAWADIAQQHLGIGPQASPPGGSIR